MGCHPHEQLDDHDYVLSLLEPDIDGVFAKGGGVGGTNRKLLRLRPC